MNAPRYAPLLLVEHDLAVQNQLTRSLDCFESATADAVASAVLQFRRYSPAVVTLDIGLLPDRDSVSEGFKCLEKPLELDLGANAILLTGQDDQGNALRAICMGAYDLFAKPVDPDVLSRTVERACRLYELQQENRRLPMQQSSDVVSGLITEGPCMQRRPFQGAGVSSLDQQCA